MRGLVRTKMTNYGIQLQPYNTVVGPFRRRRLRFLEDVPMFLYDELAEHAFLNELI